MKMLSIFITLTLCTSIVLASPGINEITPSRKAQIEKIKLRKEMSKKQLIQQIDKEIARLEKSPKKNSVKRNLKSIESKLVKSMERSSRNAKKLLNDNKKFTLAFNNAVALNNELTQYEFAQSLHEISNDRINDEAKALVIKKFEDAQTITNVLRDLKESIVNESTNTFIVDSNKNKKMRSIASVDADKLSDIAFLITIALVVPGIIVGVAMAAAGSAALGIILPWAIPLAVVVTLVVIIANDKSGQQQYYY